LEADAPHPSLDIVIVTWNAAGLLGPCLASIAAARLDGARLGRVTVVDNASTDNGIATLPPLSGLSPTFIVNRANRGFGAACNQGAAGSRADYLLFLNPDTRLAPDTLTRAVAFMEDAANARVGVSGIRLTDENGQTQRCCARLPAPAIMIGQMLGLDRLLPRRCPPHFMTEWDHADTRPVPQVMGAFLLIRRPLFDSLGGFDERFFVYYEDVDLCLRVQQAGWTCLHNADATAIHIGQGTTRQVKARRQFYSARSRILYTAKHFGRRPALAVAAICLTAEPLARATLCLARRQPADAGRALMGGLMLWRALPALLPRLLRQDAP
jgi:N-acetylglucosaminyl-diphospho-decaprenol L-rhamnosyltransferase